MGGSAAYAATVSAKAIRSLFIRSDCSIRLWGEPVGAAKKRAGPEAGCGAGAPPYRVAQEGSARSSDGRPLPLVAALNRRKSVQEGAAWWGSGESSCQVSAKTVQCSGAALAASGT